MNIYRIQNLDRSLNIFQRIKAAGDHIFLSSLVNIQAAFSIIDDIHKYMNSKEEIMHIRYAWQQYIGGNQVKK